MIPGEMKVQDGDIEINPGRETVTVEQNKSELNWYKIFKGDCKERDITNLHNTK